MEFGTREILIALGILVILAILLDGVRRVRAARDGTIRMAKRRQPVFDDHPLDEYGSELPSGGARVVAVRDEDTVEELGEIIKKSAQNSPKRVTAVFQNRTSQSGPEQQAPGTDRTEQLHPGQSRPDHHHHHRSRMKTRQPQQAPEPVAARTDERAPATRSGAGRESPSRVENVGTDSSAVRRSAVDSSAAESSAIESSAVDSSSKENSSKESSSIKRPAVERPAARDSGIRDSGNDRHLSAVSEPESVGTGSRVTAVSEAGHSGDKTERPESRRRHSARLDSHRSDSGSTESSASKGGSRSESRNRSDRQGIPEVIVLHLMARKGELFQGPQLLETLLQQGFRFGSMKIFHRHRGEDGDGEVLFSAANSVNPGTFDLSAIDDFTTPGITFFMALDGLDQPLQIFDLLHKTIRAMATDLDGELKDETRSALTRQTVEHYRQRILEYTRRSFALSN